MFGDLVVLPLYIQTRSALDHDFHSSLIMGGKEKKNAEWRTPHSAHRATNPGRRKQEGERERGEKKAKFPTPSSFPSRVCFHLHSSYPPVGWGLDWAQSRASRNKRGAARCLAGGLQGAAARLVVRTWRRIEHCGTA